MAMYEYRTETLTDFSKKKNRLAYEKALKQVRDDYGKTYPLIINGKPVTTKKTYSSENPANHEEIIGEICQASIKEADEAMESALLAFETWKKTSPQVRADVLFKAANIMRRKRMYMNALMTLEAGKPWIEADGDVAEAIDFLEYYGRQMLKMDRIDDEVQSREHVERNEYRYIPLGVGAIITPWNFPTAILTGMTSAAVVSGNTVLLKPARTTQIIAYNFVKIMEEAGLPAGVINFIPGRGSEVGDYMVKHPKTRFVSFTGSKAVGQTIYENAAKVRKGQIWLKRVITEMGGKDGILVDDDCDTNLAARSIVTSAFGFSGQKCSACSRAIIHEDVYDEVMEKVLEKTSAIQLGKTEDYNNKMGPVNSKEAFDKITEYIDIGKKEATLAAGGDADDTLGYFIQPTIFAGCKADDRIMKEEIFGPVLSVTKVNSFEEGLKIINDTEYGLTGSIISNNRAHIEKAREDFHVGNLYVNRKCTGAIVGYQPFGGFNMSGTDSKAGGPDYLTLHMQGKSICEQL